MGRNVCELLLDVLAEAGVRHIFGIPGDAINTLVDAVRRQDIIRFIQVRHEEAGAFAAAAQAKLTGGLGSAWAPRVRGRCICSMDFMMPGWTMPLFWPLPARCLPRTSAMTTIKK